MIFDIMRTAEGGIQYPVPWALTEETSFVADLATYRAALLAAPFHVEWERDRGEFSIEFTERAMALMAQGGPPVLGLNILVGEKAPVMLGNTLSMMKQGMLSPVELYARAE